MSRVRQPAMPPGASGARPDDRRATRADDPDLHRERGTGVKALTKGWALSRWGILIVLVGLGAAAIIAIAMAALAALVNASV
jgi:hypothetical protein